MDFAINELMARVDHMNLEDNFVGLAPLASRRALHPDEFAAFEFVLTTPGEVLENCTSGSAYSFSQYNSPRHGHVIIWRSNWSRDRWGWYTGVLPLSAPAIHTSHNVNGVVLSF